METESDFWALIEASRADTIEEQESLLGQLLARLAPQDLPRFQAFLDTYRQAAYRWDLWAAAYVIHGGCSDDSFDYFRYWLIAQGRAVYEAALAHPDSLIEVLPADEDDPCLEFEELGSLAIDAWERKSLLPWETAYEYQRGSIEPIGARWEEEDLPALVPRLWARFDAEL
jgi:hypothetical protein